MISMMHGLYGLYGPQRLLSEKADKFNQSLTYSGRWVSYSQSITFKLNLWNSSLDTRCDIALRWMPENPTNEKSTLVQIMARCCQATSHYLNQCWSRSALPYGITGVTRPQWVDSVHNLFWFPPTHLHFQFDRMGHFSNQYEMFILSPQNKQKDT